ncbi:DUF2726 domain-containing protein [uncultured Tolumonas sp.]|uniref:DUF2726 domain-containing protein n=1 Tax=uncultured Tolumonas sp. TaxID=263765 RepID=UPI002A0A6014|nr:DUF2726 domain-containing protein [uncultured Tolumonas sp.]
MNPLIALIIIGVVFIILVGKNKKKHIKREPSLFNENTGQIKALENELTIEQKTTYKYKKIDRIVSPAERSFLGVLNAILDDDIIILTKVRVADALTPLPTNDRSLWQRAFNSISSKHFDFVLCKSDDLSIICAVELNDKSHNNADRQDRDDFLRSACSGAGLPLIEVPAKNGYVLQEVTDLLKPYIENIATTQADISCDKCGSPMILRVSKKGSNVGRQFYGCTNYPSCRNIRDIEHKLIEL